MATIRTTVARPESAVGAGLRCRHERFHLHGWQRQELTADCLEVRASVVGRRILSDARHRVGQTPYAQVAALNQRSQDAAFLVVAQAEAALHLFDGPDRIAGDADDGRFAQVVDDLSKDYVA